MVARSPTPPNDAPEKRLLAGKMALAAAMQPALDVFPPQTQIEWENKVCEIISGTAVRRRLDQIDTVLLPGDLFGVSELFSGVPSVDLIETRETVTIRSISYPSVLRLAARDDNIAMWLLYYVNSPQSAP